MSGEEANFVTHDNVGTEPTINLHFPVIWTNTGPDDHIVRNNGMSVISTPNVRDWNSFKRDLFAPTGHTIDDLVTYIDSDDDQIPIESQCEFEEALRIATNLATKERRTKSLYLVVDRGYEPRTESTRKKIFTRRSASSLMPPTNLNDDGQVFEEIRPLNETKYNVKEAIPSDDTAPKWFTSYMQTMKEDIVAEVSKRVTKTMMEALQKKRDCQYDSATSHPRASEPEYFVDSDSDDSISKLSPKDQLDDNKDSEDSRFNISITDLLDENKDSEEPRLNISLTDLLEDNKNSESPLRSGAHRWDNNSRRRYRNPEKKRKMQNKSNVPKVSKNNESSSQAKSFYNSSPFVRRGSDNNPRNRECDYSCGPLTQSTSGNSGLSGQNLTNKNPRNTENFDDEFDTPYRRMIASGIRQMSFTPVDSTDLLEPPIIKLRLANSCHSDDTNVEDKLIKEKLRMGCSVTGNNVFVEKPNDRVPEYCALSDSDNISIISDVSHNSEMQRISNSFEMILDRSMNFPDETDDDRDIIITTEYEENNCAEERINDDIEANRDSSSFELLSEPVSPPLSIHMDEDHFSPDKREIKNYNINDDTSVEKRGNQNKMKSSTLAIDEQGKIYQFNIIDTCDNEDTEVILEKRRDGTYSFVADTLPGSTRDSMIKTSRTEVSIDETTVINDDSVNATDADKTRKTPNETKLEERSSEEIFNDFINESTQSFHSHASPQTENERQDFAGYSSNGGHEEIPSATSSHIFVDENVSKGLGDTRKSSPRKQEFGDKCGEDCTWERPKTSRKQSNGTHHHGSSGKRNGNSRQGDRSRKFGNWSTTRSTRIIDDFVFNAVDPMHILPETLVTGAVHVAASAYTTARRVYDKILTAQTRKPADKSKFGRR